MDSELDNLRKYGYSQSNYVLVDLSTPEIIDWIENQKEEIGCKNKSTSWFSGWWD